VELSPEQIDAFLDKRHTLVLATLRRNGTAHLTTVWYRWDGKAFWISTNRDRAKFRHIERDPRVTVLVDDPPRETSVAADGEAEIAARDAAAYQGSLAIVGRYVDDPAAYLAQREGEPRALLRIEPARIRSWKP
jgi:PPOX class probable F420-dependent enzyme